CPAVSLGAFFLLVNSEIKPQWQCVDDRIIPIGRRSVSLLLNEALMGNLMRVYIAATKNGWLFQLRAIPDGTCAGGGDGAAFDPKFMRCLFDAGWADASTPRPWLDDPLDAERALYAQ